MPDILTQNRPALSATSDAPVIEQPDPPADPPVVDPPEPPAADPPADPPVEPAEPAAPVDDPADPPAESKKRPGVHQALYEQRQKAREADERTARAVEAAEKAAKVAKEAADALEAIRKAQEKTPEQIAQEAAAADPRPTRDKFDDPDAYDEALAEWGGRKALRDEGLKAAKAAAEKAATDSDADKTKTEAEQQAERIAQQQETITDRWTAAQTKAEAEHEDFLATTFENPNFKVSEGVGIMLLRSDNGPQAMYALGKNPTEAARLSAISDPIELAIEFGKFTATLTPPKAQPPRLPTPITPVNSRAGASEPDLYKIGNEGSTEEYAARRMQMPDMRRRPGGTLAPVGSRPN